MGSAPRGPLAAGMTQAIAALDAPAGTPSSGSVAPAQPPASPPSSPPESGPPAGSRSLGADLREQPSPSSSDPSKSPAGQGLVDPEPFLE